MLIEAKKFYNLFLPVLFITGMVLLSACENDLRKIKAITDQEINKPIEKTTGVEVIVSDSAVVKAKMLAPLLIQFDDKVKPYTEAPKGIKVIFFDHDLKETSTIVADYAIYHTKDKLIEMRKNVVASNAKGETFKSDELIWDQNTRQIHSNKVVHVTFSNGSQYDGTSFKSDENLNHWYMNQSTGKINVDQNISQ
jgi:LPS export ABC transporter protein LptC